MGGWSQSDLSQASVFSNLDYLIFISGIVKYIWSSCFIGAFVYGWRSTASLSLSLI